MYLEMKQADKGAQELTGSLRAQHLLLKQLERLNFYGLDIAPWKQIRNRIDDIETMNQGLKRTSDLLRDFSGIHPKFEMPGQPPKPIEVSPYQYLYSKPKAPTGEWAGYNGPAVKIKAQLDIDESQLEALTRQLASEQIPLHLGDVEADEKAALQTKLGLQYEYDEKIRAIRQGRADWEWNLIDIEIENERRGMEMRAGAYEAGFNVMGQWSAKFFNDSARRSRTLNAMMIAGFGETLASYIEAKTKEARYQVIEGTAQSLFALARGDWRAAGLYAAGAAQWAPLAIGGALAANAARMWSQQKAESISSTQEQEWNTATGETGGASATAARRQATGVVNTRPIAINVYSTANFNSGYMIFGDSETAANDLYDRVMRDKIEGDIESGMIAIPA
jgi:hypothetical protein